MPTHGSAHSPPLDRLRVRVAGNRVPARVVLEKAAVSNVVPVGSGVSGARRSDHHQVRPDSRKHFVPQPQPLEHPGGVVLDHDVALRHQVQSQFLAPLLGQVERRVLLGLVIDMKRRPARRRVGTARAPHLDDLRAHEREMSCGRRSRDYPGEVSYGEHPTAAVCSWKSLFVVLTQGRSGKTAQRQVRLR